jgi:uncharacterized membrane protein
MAFCSNCGSQVQGAFCMRCGTAVAGAPQPPAQPQPPQQQQPQWQQPPHQQQQPPPNYGQQQQPPPPNYGQQQQPPQNYGQPQYGQPPHGQPQYGQPQYGQPAPAAAGGLDENVASALCYLFTIITGVVFLVLEPYNKMKTVRFHAFQAIFFGLAAFVLNIVMTIIATILYSALNYSLWFIPKLLSLGLGLALMGVWILLMYKAYNREYFKLPVIGDLAEKQA